MVHISKILTFPMVKRWNRSWRRKLCIAQKLLPEYSSLLSVAVIITKTKSNLEEGLFFHLTSYSKSLRKAGAQRQKPGTNTMGEHCLMPSFLSITQLGCFLIQLRISYLRVVPPTVGWALLNQLAIKKMPYRYVHRPNNLIKEILKLTIPQIILNCDKLIAEAN